MKKEPIKKEKVEVSTTCPICLGTGKVRGPGVLPDVSCDNCLGTGVK